MNYKEAVEYCLTVKWKTTVCNSGDECWCRIIEPEEEIKYDNGKDIYIIGSGSMPKEYAEHIVKIHNDSLEKN